MIMQGISVLPISISTLYPAQCVLGESPLWHKKRQCYLWVDIEGKSLYELHPKTKRFKKRTFSSRVSVVLENERNGVVLGTQEGIIEFDFKRHSSRLLTGIESNITTNRTNDAACDYIGRIWIGTMDIGCADAAGSLYCIDTRLQVKKILSGITIPNGLAWSSDNETMYFVDTTARVIKAYSFDSITGAIADERIVIRIPPSMGMPDGMAMDEDGMLWIALYGGFGIGRWDPSSGTLIQTIPLPVPNVTNCCFAGHDLDQLLVTTARENLSKDELEKYPQSGDVFLIKNIGVNGAKLHKAFYE